MRRHKRAPCTNSDHEKMANLGDKGRFGQKWRVCQKFIKSLVKYSNEMTKGGMSTVGDFYKNEKFSEKATLAGSSEWLAK